MRRASELIVVTAVVLFAAGRTDGAEPRLVTERGGRQMYVITDKPLYRPGETIWFRSWELLVLGFAPVANEHAVTFDLVDPKGAVVATRKVRSTGGLAANDIALPPDLAGGRYTLRVSSDQGVTDERSLLVASYETPRLKKKLTFSAMSYRPGEVVTALVELERGTGGPLPGAKVEALLWLDGRDVERAEARTDKRGAVSLRLRLPAAIARGDALLTIIASDGGATESLQRRVPIALARAELQLYPEGGDLVTGLASRVYFRALDPMGEPIDATLVVADETGREVTRAKTTHRGMGRFELTPEPGRRYQARALGLEGQVALPLAATTGCVLRSDDDYRSERPLTVRVTCTENRDVVVTAVLREALVDQRRVRISGSTSVALPASSAQGAVRVTVFADDLTPLAERLVYRGLGRDARVEIRADRERYSPRDKVTLALRTTDAAGRPIPAEVAVAVVDDAVLSLADDKTGHILSRLYLEPEMPGQKIREPNFYFSTDAKAPEAMDRLLGTQGWRRFTWRWEGR